MPPPPPALPRPLAGIAVRQEGLVSSQQCRRYGLSGQQASEAVRRGDWRRITRGVFDLSGRVELIERHEIDRQRRRMAVLGALAYPGAVVTGVAALVLHGVQGAPVVIRPEVTFPDGSPRRAQPAVRLRRLRLSQWLTLGDIALATVPDALAQAVPQLERRHGVAMMDSARHQLRLSEAELRAAHDRARFSPGVLRTHPWWDESDPRAESPAETWARLACVDAGIPPDALQLRVLDRSGRLLARVDLAWLLPDGRWLLVEIDGRDEHEAPTALFRDRTRQNSILTDRTLMRRYTGAESLDGTLAGQLTTLLRTVGWQSGRPTPDFVQLLTS
ncbi:MAG: type IV toxin-antitoxin system AbiEi family antitoxin domain-containing protein [Propionicimonas sp.]